METNTTQTLATDLRYWNLRGSERRMNARYTGRCRICGGDVRVGMAIAFDPATRTVRHTIMAECHGQRSATTVRTRTAPAARRQSQNYSTGRVCTNCGGRVPAWADHGLCDNCG